MNEEIEGTEGALFSGESFSIGDHVRLVNLPAHPGLEGLIGTVVGADSGLNRIHVKLHLNGVIKRVRSSMSIYDFQVKCDKLEHVLTGSIVKLKGLVSALGLNGQLCECQEFDFDLKRYHILTKKGDVKKVKPENLEFIARLATQIPSIDQLLAVAAVRKEPSKLLQLFTEYQLPVPLAVPGKILVDCMQLESDDLRRTLIESKPVSIDRLEDFRTRLFFLSLPRSACNPDYSAIRNFQQIADFYKTASAKYPMEQIFFILPQTLAEDAALPLQRRAVACAYPLAIASCCAVVFFGSEADDWQHTDLLIGSKIKIRLYNGSGRGISSTGVIDYASLMADEINWSNI